ncbi:hypothetical protein [Nocardia sp. NPDC047038]
MKPPLTISSITVDDAAEAVLVEPADVTRVHPAVARSFGVACRIDVSER